ncbi:hypothetical protein MMC10_008176 [Thelotrema lepadinum]|nr:hypothetical protein [Thelotrema lepadinum]
MATPPDTQDEEMAVSYSTPATSSGLLRAPTRSLLAGVYAPTPCFFDHNEEVDVDAISKHTARLARAGLAGITTQGSNGEAVHLAPYERQLVTHTTRAALDNAGFTHIPIIVGCGAQSTRESISLCREAAESGGDYVLILPPSYYKASYSHSSLLSHFRAIASASPLPVVIYNYPGAAAGIDLDSDTLLELAKHPNIVGAKLTCANVGKLARVVAGTSSSLLTPDADKDAELAPPLLHTPKTTPTPSISDLTPEPDHTTSSPAAFTVLAGSADFLLPSLSVGAAGGLVGLANITPKTCVALQRAYEANDFKRARWLQEILARSDEVVQKMGVVGTKVVLQALFKYGGHARRPLPRVGEDISNEQAMEWVRGFQEAMNVEEELR